MSSHDENLLLDAMGPIKAFDMNGNFNYDWYGTTSTFTETKKVYEVFIYNDGSKQLSYYLTDEPIFSSW